MEGYFLLIYMQGLMPETRIGIAARVGAIRASLEKLKSGLLFKFTLYHHKKLDLAQTRREMALKKSKKKNLLTQTARYTILLLLLAL